MDIFTEEKSIPYHNTEATPLVQEVPEHKLLAAGRALWGRTPCSSCLAFLQASAVGCCQRQDMEQDQPWREQNHYFLLPVPALDWQDRARACTQTGLTGRQGDMARKPGWDMVGEHTPFLAFLVMLL